ncbi:MAG: hypothetical protein ACQEWM_12465 [Actinomycetota bacterium]
MRLSTEKAVQIDRLLGWSAATALIAATAALAGGLVGFVLVWGEQVVPGWLISTVLLAVVIAVAVALALLRRHRATGSAERGAAARRPAGRTAAWVVGATSVALGSGVGFVADLPATYTVLGAPAPGSCQVAVRESSFLFAGAGDVYAAGAGGVAMAVGSWTADDGYQPIASGTYDLEWEDGSAVLSLSSSAGNPVWPASHTFACP